LCNEYCIERPPRHRHCRSTHCNGDRYRNSNRDPDGHSNAHANRERYRDANQYCNADDHTNLDAAPNGATNSSTNNGHFSNPNRHRDYFGIGDADRNGNIVAD
jgi:hypothetical protein